MSLTPDFVIFRIFLAISRALLRIISVVYLGRMVVAAAFGGYGPKFAMVGEKFR